MTDTVFYKRTRALLAKANGKRCSIGRTAGDRRLLEAFDSFRFELAVAMGSETTEKESRLAKERFLERPEYLGDSG